MEYKIGDEVLVKARIIGSRNGVSRLLVQNQQDKFFVEKDNVMPVPDMTAEEAWKIAKKILLYPAHGGFNATELEEIFGRTEHLWELTPQEAKAKIEAWEQEKKIRVGDVVDHNGEIGIVTNTDDTEGFYNVLYGNGSTSAHDRRNLKKVGRHIDITGLLNQIGGTDA